MIKDNRAKKYKQLLDGKYKRIDNVIEVVLALLTFISLPTAVFDIINIFIPVDNVTQYPLWIIILVLGGSIILSVGVGVLYHVKLKIFQKSLIADYKFKREQKINQINTAVFDSIYSANSAKINEIFRYTYGTVSQWNPINYCDNVLVYDVHEQIRSILKKIEECVINIDTERLNDRNVSVELVYYYPVEKNGCTLPMGEEENIDWRLISSGDTSGNHKYVLNYLKQNNSFYVLVDSCGTVFKNNKFSEILEYQYNLLPDKARGNDEVMFIKDVKDWEHSKDGNSYGSAVGTVINIRNDNPEEIFVKAILTITTYGEPFFVKCSEVKTKDNEVLEIDKFGMTEEDYKNILIDTVVSSFGKLIETELAQMYIRHSIREGHMCPISGHIFKKDEYFAKCDRCNKMKHCKVKENMSEKNVSNKNTDADENLGRAS